ncbi:hypothetical protein WDJ51_06950 [Rathayibacter sp. YIM 133350]|uniref:hypothetical protein n=1 Tax=Rathayibacter sp. YIM 133350 TaxID=3131992 RepID=UPI00307EA88A
MSTTEPNGKREPAEPVDASVDTPVVADPVVAEPVESDRADAVPVEADRADEVPARDADVAADRLEADRVDAGRPAAVPVETADASVADDTVGDTRSYEPVAAVDEQVDGVRVETVDESRYVAPAEDPIPASAPVETTATEQYPGAYAAPTPNDAYPAQQPTPIYVQAPTPPVNKGNRGFGILVGLLATLAFAVIYSVVSLVVAGVYNGADAMNSFADFLPRPVFWLPIIGFFVAFAIVAAIINRAGWWSWVLAGFFVGVFVYFTYIAAALLTVQAWTLTLEEANRFLANQWTSPLAIGAAVIGREVPIWFGAWISSRGRKVTERNVAARREYDRKIAEGPVIERP